jgi:hypothetical protein
MTRTRLILGPATYSQFIWGRMTERMDQCGGSGGGSGGRGGFWHGAVVGKKRNCVGVAFGGGCFGDVDTVAAIVLGGWA